MSQQATNRYFKKDFWTTENLRYSEPHFRLLKVARVVNALARGGERDLLDVGCGPAALSRLLEPNIHYFGIDIAIQHPAANLREIDLIDTEISYGSRTFDIVVASGFFEYVGGAQDRKLREISRLLKPGGLFLVSYINFDHRDPVVTPLYNNIRSIAAFTAELARMFDIRQSFPTSYNWHGTPPRRRWLQRLQRHLNVTLPFLAPLLAVEFLFVCALAAHRN